MSKSIINKCDYLPLLINRVILMINLSTDLIKMMFIDGRSFTYCFVLNSFRIEANLLVAHR